LKTDRKIVASLIGAGLLVVAVAVLSFWAFSQIEYSVAARKHAYSLISDANTFLSELKDAETGQRGFSLTGDEAFLAPYLAVRRNVAGHLSHLRDFTYIAEARQHLDAMVPLVDAKLAEMAKVIELRRQREMTALLAAAGGSGEGRRLMDAIRVEMAAYIGVEEGVLARHDDELRASMRQLFALIVTASLLTFLLALSFAWLVYRDSRHRLRDLVHQETSHLLNSQTAANELLQQANTTLHLSEERLAVTLNSIGDAIIATDDDGRVTLMNPLAEQLTGWTLAEAAGHPIEEVFHIVNAETGEDSRVPVRDALAHNTIQGLANHTVVLSRSGSECHIADSCAPIRNRDGRVVGAVLVFRDVTERKRLDQVLHDRSLELERTKSVAEKANLAKSEFLSNMSHELRTPLSAVLGFAQLMESGSPPPTVSQKRSIEQILKAGWYLLDLINEILDLALIESGKLSLSMEPISLSDVMHECQTMIEPQAAKRGIRVTFPQLDGAYFVQADRTRVKQVIINLLSNAIKYNTSGGSVTIDCIVSNPQRLRLSVTDTGAGLSAEKLAQLFQPFNRLGQETDVEEGTGIGLVVCKRLIELMGGVIGVESVLGQGSVFWIELNTTAAPQTLAALPLAAAATSIIEGAKVRTLLYVEDNPTNLMLVEDLIARRADIRLVSARDGIRGIELAHALRPDVILMDINLPGISGIEALHFLLRDPLTAHIPVLALSANAMPRDIEKGLAAGFFRYMTKPIKVPEFMATLDLALEFALTTSAPHPVNEESTPC
jgi:PAS domain S-box-containing protein